MTAIEYALLAALIVVVIIAVLTLTGTNLKALYDGSAGSITAAIGRVLGGP